jgi:hypothetical protein
MQMHVRSGAACLSWAAVHVRARAGTQCFPALDVCRYGALRAVDELEQDAAYLNLLEAKQAALAEGGGGGGDSGIIFEEWTDDEETESALDSHDPFGLLVLAMNAMQSSAPQRFHVRGPSELCPSCMHVGMAWLKGVCRARCGFHSPAGIEFYNQRLHDTFYLMTVSPSAGPM